MEVFLKKYSKIICLLFICRDNPQQKYASIYFTHQPQHGPPINCLVLITGRKAEVMLQGYIKIEYPTSKYFSTKISIV